nr:MSMEG_1061 family FMN-dependent PPOX-type flavoprotein [Bradyrhizobium retamae]
MRETFGAAPRGDPPGFVRILDTRTLLVPHRVGNNRLDAMSNLLVNPRIGILFLVPGMNETLRINGTARITDDARLLTPSAMQNRAPKVGLVVTVEEAFLHCAKALVRSELRNPDKHIDRAILPSYPSNAARPRRRTDARRERTADTGDGRTRALLEVHDQPLFRGARYASHEASRTLGR